MYTGSTVRFLANTILALAANALALLAAVSFIPGVTFDWNNNFLILGRAAAVITLINIFLKPIAKMVLGPFILLSLGLAAIILNAGLLWLATYWAPELAFTTVQALIAASLLFAAVNFIFSAIGKKA